MLDRQYHLPARKGRPLGFIPAQLPTAILAIWRIPRAQTLAPQARSRGWFPFADAQPVGDGHRAGRAGHLTDLVQAVLIAPGHAFGPAGVLVPAGDDELRGYPAREMRSQATITPGAVRS
jgi:hypothetical protein